MTTVVEKKLQRSDCFKLLAACFYEPDRDLFIQEKLCDNLVSLLSACGYASASEAARGMLKALSELSDEEIKIEHARLFVGPFELFAPPYGSIYLEDKRRVMGDSTMAVQKMYQEAGLSLDIKEAPDHIAFELEFMHFLGLKEIEAEEQGQGNKVQKINRLQDEFMSKLLGPWIPALCENIRQGTDNSFYVHLADCLDGFSKEITAEQKVSAIMQKAEVNNDSRASA